MWWLIYIAIFFDKVVCFGWVHLLIFNKINSDFVRRIYTNIYLLIKSIIYTIMMMLGFTAVAINTYPAATLVDVLMLIMGWILLVGLWGQKCLLIDIQLESESYNQNYKFKITHDYGENYNVEKVSGGWETTSTLTAIILAVLAPFYIIWPFINLIVSVFSKYSIKDNIYDKGGADASGWKKAMCLFFDFII